MRLEEWLGFKVPLPVPVSWHIPVLLRSCGPAASCVPGADVLGASKFDPFKMDEADRGWRPTCKAPSIVPPKADNASSQRPPSVPYVGGMGVACSDMGGLLGVSCICFDPWMYDLDDARLPRYTVATIGALEGSGIPRLFPSYACECAVYYNCHWRWAFRL